MIHSVSSSIEPAKTKSPSSSVCVCHISPLAVVVAGNVLQRKRGLNSRNVLEVKGTFQPADNFSPLYPGPVGPSLASLASPLLRGRSRPWAVTAICLKSVGECVISLRKQLPQSEGTTGTLMSLSREPSLP